MSVDREQVRKTAEYWTSTPQSVQTVDQVANERLLARHCLALLAELEQAEKERDQLETELVRRQDENFLEEQISALEARLAKVPALVEAAKRIRDGFDGDEFQDSADAVDQHRVLAGLALTAWEAE